MPKPQAVPAIIQIETSVRRLDINATTWLSNAAGSIPSLLIEEAESLRFTATTSSQAHLKVALSLKSPVNAGRIRIEVWFSDEMHTRAKSQHMALSKSALFSTWVEIYDRDLRLAVREAWLRMLESASLSASLREYGISLPQAPGRANATYDPAAIAIRIPASTTGFMPPEKHRKEIPAAAMDALAEAGVGVTTGENYNLRAAFRQRDSSIVMTLYRRGTFESVVEVNAHFDGHDLSSTSAELARSLVDARIVRDFAAVNGLAVRTAEEPPEAANVRGSQLQFSPAIKIAILPLDASGVSLRSSTVASLSDQLATTLQAIEGVSTVTTADLNAVMELENRQEVLGCSEARCFAEIGAALGADMVVHGRVSEVEGLFRIALSLVDSTTIDVKARALTVNHSTESGLLRGTPAVANKLMAQFGRLSNLDP